MKRNSFIFLPAFLFFILFSSHVCAKKPDLMIVSMETEYQEGTLFRVTIIYYGKKPLESVDILIRDLDFTEESLNKAILKEEERNIIASNLLYEEEDNYYELLKETGPLQPNEKVSIEFLLPEYWIYDPNCEAEIIIDPENKIKESNEKNNHLLYIRWG